MKLRLSLVILVCAAVWASVVADASALQLSMATARRDIHRVLKEAEQPTAMRLSRCHRLSPLRVRCHVQLTQVVQPTPTEIGTITELAGMATATLRTHRHPSFRYIDVRY